MGCKIVLLFKLKVTGGFRRYFQVRNWTPTNTQNISDFFVCEALEGRFRGAKAGGIYFLALDARYKWIGLGLFGLIKFTFYLRSEICCIHTLPDCEWVPAENTGTFLAAWNNTMYLGWSFFADFKMLVSDKRRVLKDNICPATSNDRWPFLVS